MAKNTKLDQRRKTGLAKAHERQLERIKASLIVIRNGLGLADACAHPTCARQKTCHLHKEIHAGRFENLSQCRSALRPQVPDYDQYRCSETNNAVVSQIRYAVAWIRRHLYG